MDKDDKVGTQLYSGAQVKNVINKIIGRINAFNPTEIQQLKSSAASISTEGLDPEIAHELKDLIASIVEKEKEEKNSLIANILSENQCTADEAAQVQAWKEEMLRFMDTQAIYSNFDAMSPAYLEEQKKYNNNFKEALEVAKLGKEISEELKREMKKTPNQIEEEKKKWQQIKATKMRAHEEHGHHTTRINEIDQILTEAGNDISAETKKKLHNHRKFHVECKKEAGKKIEQVTKHCEELEKAAKNLIQAKRLTNQPNINQTFFEEQENLMRTIHQKSPEQIVETGEKYKRLKQETILKNIRTQTKTEMGGASKGFCPSSVPNNSKENLNKWKGGRW